MIHILETSLRIAQLLALDTRAPLGIDMPRLPPNVRRAEGVDAEAAQPGKGLSLDQPEGALGALDDAGRRIAKIFFNGGEGLFALLHVRVGVENLHSIHVPPSTLMVWPVRKSLSLEARNTTVPMRSSGYWSRFKARDWRRGARYSSASIFFWFA